MSLGTNRQPLGSNTHHARQTSGGTTTGKKHHDKRAESPALRKLRERMGKVLCKEGEL